MVMYTDLLSTTCMKSYTFMEGLAIHLSASDVSAFLHGTRLFRMVGDEFKKKYMNISRDLHMVEDWLKQMTKDGNVVMAMGRDLDLLMDRYTKPMTHWVMHPDTKVSTILLMTMSRVGFSCLPEHRYVAGDGIMESYGITAETINKMWIKKNGEIVEGKVRDANWRHRMKYGGSPLNPTIPVEMLRLPGPDMWPRWNSRGKALIHTKIYIDQPRIKIMTFSPDAWLMELMDLSCSLQTESLVMYDKIDGFILPCMNLMTNDVRVLLAERYFTGYSYIDSHGHRHSGDNTSARELSVTIPFTPRNVCSDTVFFKAVFEMEGILRPNIYP